jgi:hypothetical protein
MNRAQKLKACKNFKAIKNTTVMCHKIDADYNCKSCPYFSSINCGMDTVHKYESLI